MPGPGYCVAVAWDSGCLRGNSRNWHHLWSKTCSGKVRRMSEGEEITNTVVVEELAAPLERGVATEGPQAGGAQISC